MKCLHSIYYAKQEKEQSLKKKKKWKEKIVLTLKRKKLQVLSMATEYGFLETLFSFLSERKIHVHLFVLSKGIIFSSWTKTAKTD